MITWIQQLYRRALVACAPRDFPASGADAPWGMRVQGNDDYGYTARYAWERNSVWASRRETAIFGCAERARECLGGAPLPRPERARVEPKELG